MNITNNILCATALSALCMAASCSRTEKESAEVVRPVRYQEVLLRGGEQTRTFSGVSKAGKEVNLSFKVSGTVKAVNVKVGDRVTRGKIIARIDESDFRLMYEQAEAALENAVIQMQAAKSAFERTAALYENRNISLQDFEGAKTLYESAKAAVTASRRGMQLARSRLHDSRLAAPMAGIVAKVHIETNENVMPGQVVVEINSGNSLEVTVGMPESYIARITEGEKAEVRFAALAGKTFEGIISEVSYAISSESSTYPVSIILTDPDMHIRPGMAASVTITFKSENGPEHKIIVPVHTVAEDREGRHVFTVTENENGLAEVRKKPVKTGELTSMGLEVLEGLSEGELLVTAGISRLSDGMTVKLLR
jgi:RND family efflux transporter MFP subunit